MAKSSIPNGRGQKRQVRDLAVKPKGHADVRAGEEKPKASPVFFKVCAQGSHYKEVVLTV